MSKYVSRTKILSKPVSSRLRHLDIELTERCNNCCIHCYINQAENDTGVMQREMGTEFVKDILRQAEAMGCLSVLFTGGEPLLRHDFAELYIFTRQLGLKVKIFTNGRLITSRLAKLFSKIPPQLPIEVSVYGMHADTYDSVVAVRGAFQQFQRGVGLLREHQIPFVVKQSVLPQIKTEKTEFEEFAAAVPYMSTAPDYTVNFDLRGRRDNPAKNRLIKSLRLSPAESIHWKTRDRKRYRAEMKEFAAKFMRPAGNRLFSCGAGLGACVDAYGNAQMCMLLRHPDTVYSLDRRLHSSRHPETLLSPLEYVVTEVFPKLRLVCVDNPEYLKRCGVCFLRGLCGQCPARSWEEHGTLDKPVDYFCQVAHRQAEDLGLIIANEKAWELSVEVQQSRLQFFITEDETDHGTCGHGRWVPAQEKCR